MTGKELDGFPSTFTHSDARHLGMSDRELYALRDAGAIQSIGWGVYRRTDAGELADIDLLEIAHRAQAATCCLASALARHDLTDLIPATIDVALPRGRRRPRTRAPVTWHMFAPETFDIGRGLLQIDEQTSIGFYSPERCIIDAFRLRHREGRELAYTALRRWLARPDSQPSTLLSMARHFPHAQRALREALDILL
jgi:predicted transcriptional regulator of viral defense system